MLGLEGFSHTSGLEKGGFYSTGISACYWAVADAIGYTNRKGETTGCSTGKKAAIM